MKITKEEFADRIIGFIHELDFCPRRIGFIELKECVSVDDCEKCWQQAIEQGVEK